MDSGINNKRKNFEVEHSYCDFQQMILGQKVRKFKKNTEANPKPNYTFDDYELSKLLSREIENDNIDFYKGETVQKLIACQWETSKFWWKQLFQIYFFLFMIPFMLSIIMDPNIDPNPDLDKLESSLEDDKYNREIKYW